MDNPRPGWVQEHDALSPRHFARITALAKQRFGIDLKPGKEELVAARLRKKARELRLGSISAYCDHVLNDRTGESLLGLIDALTTNHTAFLRERAHFEFFVRHVLPDRATEYGTQVWSAACSTGEEPYTLCMAALEAMGSSAFARLSVLATDISGKALEAARNGIYPAERVAELPAEWVRRYFLKGQGAKEGWYKIRPEVAAMVEFRRLNLVGPWPPLGSFHAIFCRNVMIYFDRAAQARLVNRLAACLKPGGYLFVGHAESLTGIEHPLTYVQPAIYRRGGLR